MLSRSDQWDTTDLGEKTKALDMTARVSFFN